MCSFRSLPAIRLNGLENAYDVIVGGNADKEQVVVPAQLAYIFPFCINALAELLHQNITAFGRERFQRFDNTFSIVRPRRPEDKFFTFPAQKSLYLFHLMLYSFDKT